MRSIEDSLRTEDFFILDNFAGEHDVALKIEGLNLAGSIKLRTAKALLNHAEQHNGLLQTGRFIESSSGNLGVALSMLAASRGYSFTCVVDLNTNANNIAIMKAMGAAVVVIEQKDEAGGYLGSRKRYIREQIEHDADLIWLNQYECAANPQVHSNETASQIHQIYPDVGHLYVGAGTTGTAMGLANYFRFAKPSTRLIAVDSAGSVTFGGQAGPRHLPGLGASVCPVFFRAEDFDQLITIDEAETVAMSRYIARRYGLLLGASTCTVLAGIYQDAQSHSDKVVAISPDLGTKYVETMFNDAWCDQQFGDAWRSFDFESRRSVANQNLSDGTYA